jgi:hypothetical protein
MDEIVAEPTMILAGEAGPEHVGITPMRGGGPPESAPVVNVDLSAMEAKLDKLGDVVQILGGIRMDNEEHARKQKGATLDAGKQR